MLIPWRSDAPLYHRPWATGALIAANTLIFLLTIGAAEEQVGPLLLRYGTIQPLQWGTSAFLHAGWTHLLGNMLFLWVFGLIIEGKVGPGRFLAIYGGILVATGLVEQVLMLGARGGSLGASGILFGLMAIALIWAPENEGDCPLVLGVAVKTVEMRVRTLALLYVVFQVLDVLISGLRPTSGLLHLLGMAAGLPVGIVMLRRGWVDCEGWDWFSRRDRSLPAARRRGIRSGPER